MTKSKQQVKSDKERARELTEATHVLCVKLANALGGTAHPINPEYRSYHYPIECKISLDDNKVLGETPVIAVKVINHKPTHIKVRGLYPVSDKAGAFTPLQAPLAVCTSSRMKDVRLIARQIRGKFMQTFLPVVENCILDMRATERTAEMADAEALLLKGISGIERRPKDKNNVISDGRDMTFTCHGGKVTVNWTCTSDLACEVALLYRKAKEKG